MNRILGTFAEFRTEDYLPEGWVKKVWLDNGFARYIAFPSEYEVVLEEISIDAILKDFHDSLRNWFLESGTSLEAVVSEYCGDRSELENDLSWQTLIDEGLNFKALISILGTLILRFQEEATNSQYFVEALHAIRLYSLLIAIPGSHLCQIFNATLYSFVMAVMRIALEQVDAGCSATRPGKRKNNDDADNEDNEGAKLTCNKHEVLSLINDFLDNSTLIVENRKFRMDESSLNLTVQILVMATKLEKVNGALLIYNLNQYKRESASCVAYKSFLILLRMAKMMHNDVKKSVKSILAELMPIFLLTESRSTNIGAKEGVVIRANYTCFLKLLLNDLGDIAHDSVNILIQRICVSVPDRAEMRVKATATALDIIKISPPALQARQIYSIIFISHMSENKPRLLTLEMIYQLLLDETICCRILSEDYAAIVNESFLLAIVFYRCQDTSTNIRTKALSYLDQFTNLQKNCKVKKLMDRIFIDPYNGVSDPNTVDGYKKEIFDTQQFLANQGDFDDPTLDPLPGARIILQMLVQFSHEDKVFIKKCAIQLLSRIMQCNRLWVKREYLEVFLVGCDDSSVLVRRTMCQIITDLIVMYPDHTEVITCWVEGVCPLIADEEVKAQEKVVEHYSKVILNNIMLYEHTTSIVSRLPWLIMKEILKQNKRCYLHFAVSKWVQNNSVKNKTIQVIYSHLETENNDPAWCLILSFSQLMNLPSNELIFKQYERIKQNWDALPYSQLVVETLYHVCTRMPQNIKDNLLRQMETDLMECRIPLKLIGRCRDICERLITDASDKKTAHLSVKEWSTPKIMNCLNYIESQISQDSPIDVVDETKLMNYVFLLGELAQPDPKHVPKSFIKLLLNVLIAPKNRSGGFWRGRVTTSMKAVTILTLVKLSLQKEETASSIMPIFREILSSNAVSPSIQVNAIIGMCDLCSRYTTLVERYFTCICGCFNSQHECVRKTALVSLMKRIREEYVKLRPFILFPMLTMILDKSVEVRRTVATFIEIDLRKKGSTLETFYTGLFFFLNNCKNHSTTVKISDEIRTMFSYTNNPKTREYIYTYVLDKLADTARRVSICKKIIGDIMASIADENLKLDEKTEAILSDAFTILIDNEKKLANAISKKKGNTEEEEEIEETETSQAKKGAAVHVTEAMRMNEIAEMMPILFKLKVRLKRHKSSCYKDLILFMCELLRNYKEETSNLLTGDMELKAEVDYQLKKMEHELEEQRRAERAAENPDNEDTPPPAPVISQATLMEIRKQLIDLHVHLPRCDDLVPGLVPTPAQLPPPQDQQQEPADENAANGEEEDDDDEEDKTSQDEHHEPEQEDGDEQMDVTEPLADDETELENSMPIGGDTETETEEDNDGNEESTDSESD